MVPTASSIRTAWARDGMCMWTDDSYAAELLFISLTEAPNDPDIVAEFITAVERVYNLNPQCFGMIVDLREVDLKPKHLEVAVQFGHMFHGMDQNVRARASRGVVIVTTSVTVCDILDAVTSMFPSPVPVNSAPSMAQALVLVQA